MNEKKKSPHRIPLAAGEVFCHRLQRPLPLEEHEKCLYCFGEAGEILTGDHTKFCDFDPKKDPINFGFPDGGGWSGER
jgi:hypothetical protein